MPQLFKIGEYVVYFWSNEGFPVEPVHVHIVKGDPAPGATKVWITADGRALLCNNNSRIPKHTLNFLLRAIEANSSRILSKWKDHFEKMEYYC